MTGVRGGEMGIIIDKLPTGNYLHQSQLGHTMVFIHLFKCAYENNKEYHSYARSYLNIINNIDMCTYLVNDACNPPLLAWPPPMPTSHANLPCPPPMPEVASSSPVWVCACLHNTGG